MNLPALDTVVIGEDVCLALEALNRRIAAIYRQDIKHPRFQFVPIIDQRVVLNDLGQTVIAREVLGDCNHQTGVIRVAARRSWRSTVVHEMVHLYNPGRSEPWVTKATLDVVRLLKQGALWPKTAGETV